MNLNKNMIGFIILPVKEKIMKKQNTFLSAALVVLTIALTAFFMAGCSNGDDSGGGGTPAGITVP